MIVAFIGFGKVAQTLVKLIKSSDIEFITSLENRSLKTVEAIKNSNVKILDTFKEVALSCDVLISANSPKSALKVAKEYGKYVNGIYLDLNNISPATACEINKYANNFVDASIIGKIDSEKSVLYLSGKNACELSFLNDFIQTRIISDKIGDASILKMLRSSYTKTLSAILIESVELAGKYGLEDEFFNTLSLTEGEGFRNNSDSRIKNTLNNSKRKSEELKELIEYFKDDDLVMVKAALEKLNQ